MRRRQLLESLFPPAELHSYREGRLSELLRKVEELDRDVFSLSDRSPQGVEDGVLARSKAADVRAAILDARSVITDASGRKFNQYLAEGHQHLAAARAVFQEHVVKQKELARQYGKRGGRGHTADEPRVAGHPHVEYWAREVEAIISRTGLSRAGAYKHIARTWIDGEDRHRSWMTIRDAVNAHLKRK